MGWTMGMFGYKWRDKHAIISYIKPKNLIIAGKYAHFWGGTPRVGLHYSPCMENLVFKIPFNGPCFRNKVGVKLEGGLKLEFSNQEEYFFERGPARSSIISTSCFNTLDANSNVIFLVWKSCSPLWGLLGFEIFFGRGVGGGGVLDPNKTHPNIYEPYVVTFANQTPRIEWYMTKLK